MRHFLDMEAMQTKKPSTSKLGLFAVCYRNFVSRTSPKPHRADPNPSRVDQQRQRKQQRKLNNSGIRRRTGGLWQRATDATTTDMNTRTEELRKKSFQSHTLGWVECPCQSKGIVVAALNLKHIVNPVTHAPSWLGTLTRASSPASHCKCASQRVGNGPRRPLRWSDDTAAIFVCKPYL